MRTQKAALFGAIITAIPLAVLACKKDDATPPPATPYGTPGASAYGPQPGYPPNGQYAPPPGYPAAQPTAPPTGAPGQLAVPGPAALPCTNDSMCMTHKCNTQYGKCAFPCASDADCITGAYCFQSAISTCLPKPPGQ